MAGESIFVNDGCTLTGSFPAVPGLHPAGTFTYRPATDALRHEYQGAVGQEKIAVGRRIISRQIRGVCIADAPAVRLMPEQVGQLHADIFAVLLDAALGYSAPTVEDEGNSPSPSESG